MGELMSRFVGLAVATLLAASAANAQMDMMAMQKANGLAGIIAKSSHCGYEVDQPKLEAYFSENGLDTPETLSFIDATVQTADLLGEPSASDCTMAKATARAIGVLVTGQ